MACYLVDRYKTEFLLLLCCTCAHKEKEKNICHHVFLVFFRFLLILMHWENICYAMAAIAIKHMCGLSE